MKNIIISLITLFITLLMLMSTVKAQLICSGCATGTPSPILPAGGGTYSNPIVLTKEAVFTIAGSGDFHLTGIISENGGSFGLRVKAPEAKLFLSANNTYTGATTVETGTLGGTSLAQSAAAIEGGAALCGGAGAGNPGTLTVKRLTLSAKTGTIAVYASATALSLIKAGADGKGELTAAAAAINIVDPVTLAEGDYPIILAKTVAKPVSDFTINSDNSGCCVSVIQTAEGIYLRIRRVTITGNAMVCANSDAVLTAAGLGITSATSGEWTSQSNSGSVGKGKDELTAATDNPVSPGKSKTNFHLNNEKTGTLTAIFKLSGCHTPFNYTVTVLPSPTVFFNQEAGLGIIAGTDLEHSPGTVNIVVDPVIAGTQFKWQVWQSEGGGDLKVLKEATLKSLPKTEEALNTPLQTEPIVFKVAATAGTMKDLIIKVYPQITSQGLTCQGPSKTANVPVKAVWNTTHVPGSQATSNESSRDKESKPVAVCSGGETEIKLGSAGDGNLYGWYRMDMANVKEGNDARIREKSATTIKDHLTVRGTQSEKVFYYISSSNGTCEISTVIPVTVLDVPSPKITGLSPKSSICSNSEVAIELKTNVNPAEKDRITYTWTVSENKVGATAESTGVKAMPHKTLVNPEITDQSVIYTFTPFYSHPNSETVCTGKPATSEVLVKGTFNTGTITGVDATAVCKGESASLSITPVGAGTWQYQWMKDGKTIAKANTAAYRIPSNEISSGSYTVKVSNECESKTSEAKLLNVIETFKIGSITGVEAKAICQGAESASLLITPVGNKTLQYQWMKDGAAIANANAAAYQIPTNEISSGSYTVKVSSECESKTSEAKLLNVIETFKIGSITGVEANAICQGAESASLLITPVGNKTLQYQWMKDGAAIANANTAAYQIATNEISSGSYTVKVSSECESKTSEAKLLNVIETFKIGSITGVEAKAICQGAESASLLITPVGNKTLQYQWMKDGAAIANANAAAYQIPTNEISSGSYTVKVSSECETQTSEAKLLNVIETFKIGSITGVEEAAVCLDDQPAPLSIAPVGNQSLQYQWMKDGSVIAHANTATYRIVTDEISSGSYTVKVSSECESQTSEAKLLNVTADAWFVNGNASASAEQTKGSPVKFTYTGPAALYSWDFNDNSPVSTLQNPEHKYEKAGTWTPVLTVVKSAAQTRCNKKFVLSPIEITAESKTLTGDIEPRLKISVYPVPAKDQITISSREELTGLTLSDASGRNLIHEEAHGHDKILSLSTLLPGIYILNIITGEGVNQVKIIKE